MSTKWKELAKLLSACRADQIKKLNVNLGSGKLIISGRKLFLVPVY